MGQRRASIGLVVCDEAYHAESLAQTHIIGQKTALEARRRFVRVESTDVVFVPENCAVNHLNREK